MNKESKMTFTHLQQCRVTIGVGYSHDPMGGFQEKLISLTNSALICDRLISAPRSSPRSGAALLKFQRLFGGVWTHVFGADVDHV